MSFEKPEVELVRIDISNSITTLASNCIQDQSSSQGGGSCIGNQDHSHGDGCYDTAPLIQD